MESGYSLVNIIEVKRGDTFRYNGGNYTATSNAKKNGVMPHTDVEVIVHGGTAPERDFAKCSSWGIAHGFYGRLFLDDTETVLLIGANG